MDAVSRGTVFVCPRARRLEVVFDPRGTMTFMAGGRPLAYGTIGTRVVNRACRSLGHLHGAPSGALAERAEATKLTCALPGSVRFEVHPITALGGGEVGSSVVVLSPDVHRILLAAVLVASESRIYYTRACRTR